LTRQLFSIWREQSGMGEMTVGGNPDKSKDSSGKAILIVMIVMAVFAAIIVIAWPYLK
jgi:hypothetical protein